MTEEEKELLLKDLCARLPYGVKIKIRGGTIRTVRAVDVVEGIVHFVEPDTISPFGVHIEGPMDFRQKVKPYLRPMSSMTEKEKIEFVKAFDTCHRGVPNVLIDFYNAHHLDYRGLIEKGLALEAPEDMYKTEQNMTQEELIEFLSKNLTIEVSHPRHDVGYFGTCMEPDEHNITVAVKLCGKLICEDTSY